MHCVGVHRLVTHDRTRLFAGTFEGDTEILEDVTGDTFLTTQQAEQQVLASYVAGVEAPCFIDGNFNSALGARSKADFARRTAFSLTHYELNGRPDLGKRNSEIGEYLGGNAALFVNDAEQNVLGVYVAMSKALCFLLSFCQDFASAF
jgi:hypothetical protein